MPLGRMRSRQLRLVIARGMGCALLFSMVGSRGRLDPLGEPAPPDRSAACPRCCLCVGYSLASNLSLERVEQEGGEAGRVVGLVAQTPFSLPSILPGFLFNLLRLIA